MDIENFLRKNFEEEYIYIDEPMSNHTTFKTGGNADFFVKAKKVEDFKHILNFAKDSNVPVFILGNGSNVLVRDKGIRGVVCKVDIEKFEVKQEGEYVFVTVGAGNKNAITAQKLLKLEIEGFEFASRNSTEQCGGAIKMNAGAHGKEMKDIIASTEYIDENGNIQKIDLKEHKFDYRKSIFSNKKYIILESTLKLKRGKKEEINAKMNEYLEYRKEKQPIDMPSGGSTFKRGKDFIASKVIDECGLKGKQIGGAKVSEKHAGFIVNTGNATTKDILELVEYVKKAVFDKTGKMLELEVEVIGEE